MIHHVQGVIVFCAVLLLQGVGHQLLAPGESVGNVRIGDARDSVTSTLGKATKESNFSLAYVSPKTREILTFVLPDTQTVQAIIFTSSEYQTPDGLSVEKHLTTGFLAHCEAFRSADDTTAYFIVDSKQRLAFMKCSQDIVPGKKVIGVIFGKDQYIGPADLNDKLRWQKVPSESLQEIVSPDRFGRNGAPESNLDGRKDENMEGKIEDDTAETNQGNVGSAPTPVAQQLKAYSFAGISLNEYSKSAVSKLGETGAFPSQIGYFPTSSEVLIDYLSDSSYLDINMLNINNLSPIQTLPTYSGPLHSVQLILEDDYDEKANDHRVIGVDVEVLDASVSGTEIPTPGEYYDALIQKYGKPERTRVSYERDFVAEWPVREDTKLYYVARGLSRGTMDSAYWLLERKDQPDAKTGLLPVHVIYSSVSGLNRIVEDFVERKKNKERANSVNKEKNKSLF